ncbi:hypothetical protein [Bacillus tuaregi]|uniref:hypothetical protein n=1 Tax=Bacillus tuaregi TaxID=1816695 RepID=UPI0008F80DC5|nr:hypothetical protein [Bacillus tuaregi]
MEHWNPRSKRIYISIAIVVIWFFLFGIRLIDYFSAIHEKGLRETVCGTQGCNDIVLYLGATWTFSFFIIIPLIIPLILVLYWSIKKKSS